jgi:hypothetical protein
VVEAAVVGRSEIAEMIGDNAHVQLFEYTVETGSKSCLPLLRQIASRLDRSVRVASTIMGTYWYVNIMDIGE